MPCQRLMDSLFMFWKSTQETARLLKQVVFRKENDGGGGGGGGGGLVDD